MASRKAKVITKQADIDYIANITEDDITTTFIMETFGKFDGKVRFYPYDEITIPAGCYGKEGKKNIKPFTTTVGIYIFNKYFIEKDLFDFVDGGYVNETIGKGVFNSISDIITDGIMEDYISTDVLHRFLLKTQKFMPYVSILSPTYTEKLLTCTKAVNKKKAELMKKYEKELEAGDVVIATKLEKELVQFAKEYMGDDPSMDIFLSGAREGEGNFKEMFVIRGPIKNPDPNAEKKFNIATSCYIDGIKPEEYSLFANSLAAGPFSRAKKTEIGGYLEKLFLYAYQHITLDPPGSDCGTDRYITVTLTKKNIRIWMYSYIIEGSKLVELTSKNKDKYIGKTVKMRYSSMCESKTGICNMCAGNMEYRRGERNIGVASTNLPSTMKNISMKAFHDGQQKITTMDINKAFGLK